MAYFLSEMGKGLREPVYPYRTANVFGADAGQVSTEGWADIEIVDPTYTFDLSTIRPGHEVVVATTHFRITTGGIYTFGHKWYRGRDHKVLFEFSHTEQYIAGGANAFWSAIGWFDVEISENGDYSVDTSLDGPDSFATTIDFTVTGIPAALLAPPLPAKPVSTIVEVLNSVTAFFYAIYLQTYSWYWPLFLIADFFYSISKAFGSLTWQFYYFNDWVNDVATKVANILSSVDILKLLETWLTYAEGAWSWILDATTNVGVIVTDLVKDIKTALADLQSAWDSFKTNIPSLEEVILWWGDWWAEILTPLTTWWTERLKEVDTLINDTLKTWFPDYDDLVKLWADTKLFISSPLDWLLERFTDWFLGKE